MVVADAIRLFGAVALGLVGLSQIYLPHRWIALHARMAARGPAGVRGYGLVVLTVGGTVAVLHNVWSGAAMLLTLTAWLLILEGALCVLAPAVGVAGFAAAESEVRRRAVMASGIYGVVVSGVLWADRLWGVGVPTG
jgi:hypothetical protein